MKPELKFGLFYVLIRRASMLVFQHQQDVHLSAKMSYSLGTRSLRINFGIMDLESGLTTKEEVADIIFNSDDAELNDMLQKAKTHNYEIDHLIWKITTDINSHFENQLLANSDSPDERRAYLFKQIKSELVYYAHWY